MAVQIAMAEGWLCIMHRVEDLCNLDQDSDLSRDSQTFCTRIYVHLRIMGNFIQRSQPWNHYVNGHLWSDVHRKGTHDVLLQTGKLHLCQFFEVCIKLVGRDSIVADNSAEQIASPFKSALVDSSQLASHEFLLIGTVPLLLVSLANHELAAILNCETLFKRLPFLFQLCLSNLIHRKNALNHLHVDSLYLRVLPRHSWRLRTDNERANEGTSRFILACSARLGLILNLAVHFFHLLLDFIFIVRSVWHKKQVRITNRGGLLNFQMLQGENANEFLVHYEEEGHQLRYENVGKGEHTEPEVIL